MRFVLIVDTALELLMWAIFINVILSWMPAPTRRGVYYTIRRVFSDLTEPVIAPIRRIFPVSAGGLDFSPFVAGLIIEVVRKAIRGLL